MSADSVTDDTTGGETGTTRKFNRWRRKRPFFSGLFLILGGVVIIMPAYLTVKIMDILVMISTISGVSTLVIGVALISFGLGVWFRPGTAPYLGVIGIIVAVVALPTSNFGGFVLGTLCGVVGGVGALSWEDKDRVRSRHRRRRAGRGRKRPAAAAVTTATALSVVVLSAATVSGTARAQDGPQAFVPQGGEGTVTADRVTLSGGVRVEIIPVRTGEGTVDALRLSGDTLEAENLGLEIPGGPPAMMRTSPGAVSRINGDVVVVATSLTAAPGVSGGPGSPVPVTVDLGGDLGQQLTALGLPAVPVPDQLMDRVDLRGVTLGLVGLSARSGDIGGASVTY
jgi:hypothetical protein